MNNLNKKKTNYIALGVCIVLLLCSIFCFVPKSMAANTLFAQTGQTDKKDTSYLGGTFDCFPLTGFDESNISSMFGTRAHPITGQVHNHSGIDIAAPSGTPIHACASGTVIKSVLGGDTGNWIVIDHGDGIYSEYMHQSVRYAQEGDVVEAGDVIGLVGSTGDSTGPHLHISVSESDHGFDTTCRVDPYPYLFGDGSSHVLEVEYDEPVCIIAITDDETIFSEEAAVVAKYNNIYILEYDGTEIAEKAFRYYSGKVDIISYDIDLNKQIDIDKPYVLDGTVTKKNNILNILSDEKSNFNNDIVVLGNVANENNNVYSFTYENSADTEEELTQISPNSENITYIDIINNSNEMLLSSLYIAIESAIQNEASYIVLPDNIQMYMSATIINSILDKAIANDCTIISPIGDSSMNIDDYEISNQILLIGACTETGVSVESSNVSDNVAYNVVADNSIEATEYISEAIAENEDEKMENIEEDKQIFKNQLKDENKKNKSKMSEYKDFPEGEKESITEIIGDCVDYIVKVE